MNPFDIFRRRKVGPLATPEEAQYASRLAGGDSASRAEDSFEKPRLCAMSAHSLRWRTRAADLRLKTTTEINPSFELIGQDDAIAELIAALHVKGRDQHVAVIAPKGDWVREAILRELTTNAAKTTSASQWVCVTDFKHAMGVKALELPPGYGDQLRAGMDDVIDALREDIPAALAGENYRLRLDAITEKHRATRTHGVTTLIERAHQQGIAVLRTPMGYSMAPMMEGKVVKSEVFAKLPPSMQADIEQKIEALQEELMAVLQAAPRTERVCREQIAELKAEVVGGAIDDALKCARVKFAEVSQILDFLAECQRDILQNIAAFMPAHGAEQSFTSTTSISNDPAFVRYRVTVLNSNADSDAKSAPVIYEPSPTPERLIGHVLTNNNLVNGGNQQRIVPGILHLATGGYVVLDAAAILQHPGVLQTLQSVLATQRLSFGTPPARPFQTGSDSIPLNAKIIVIGSREHIAQLHEHHAGFMEHFGSSIEFRDIITRDAAAEKAIAKLMSCIAATDGLKPINAGALARLIDVSRRTAGHRESLSTDFTKLAAIARCADALATRAGRECIDDSDIKNATIKTKASAKRTAGKATGEGVCPSQWINGTVVEGQVLTLAPYRSAGARTGKIYCVIANARPATVSTLNVVSNAPHEATRAMAAAAKVQKLLSTEFANRVPSGFSATISVEAPTIETPADLDATSLAQLIALLSSLSHTPLPQNVAVAGQLDHTGRVYAMAGLTEMIEDYFERCEHSKSDTAHGVIIPRTSTGALMLDDAVLEAVEAGKFNIWPVSSVSDAMAILESLASEVGGTTSSFEDETSTPAISDTSQSSKKNGADRSGLNGVSNAVGESG